MNRIFIFTGKGGVGKTSVASAHAVKSAEQGCKTLLVSTDMAHNLEDVFEVKLGKEPVSINGNLDVYEIDPNYVMEQDYKEVGEYFRKLLMFGEEDSLDSMGMFPGMEELFSLLKISDLYKTGIYKRIIVDCAPTGETLSLLKFPELIAWYMEKIFPIEKIAVRVLAPVSKQLFKIEMPNKQAMTEVEELYLKLSELQELLKNREITSVRIVAIPEKMVVEETKRNYMYMNLYNFNVDGLYINRILPRDIGNPFFDQWLEIQDQNITELNENFHQVPTYNIPWYDEELKGIDAVKRIGDAVLSSDEVFDVKITTQREAFEKNEHGYSLTVSIPYAKKEELDLYQSESDLVIRLGNFKRNIPLPNALRAYAISSAKLENKQLILQFQIKEDTHEL